jgi:mannose-6-phosphate isomerase-like protein (cupin superfamily)
VWWGYCSRASPLCGEVGPGARRYGWEGHGFAVFYSRWVQAREGEDFQAADLERAVALARTGDGYAARVLSSDLLSVGVYVLPTGGEDLQQPHREDEVYYVVRGRSRFRAGAEEEPVQPGSLLFVRAAIDHRFFDIEEELVIVVFWAPPEKSVPG